MLRGTVPFLSALSFAYLRRMQSLDVVGTRPSLLHHPHLHDRASYMLSPSVHLPLMISVFVDAGVVPLALSSSRQALRVCFS